MALSDNDWAYFQELVSDLRRAGIEPTRTIQYIEWWDGTPDAYPSTDDYVACLVEDIARWCQENGYELVQ